MDPRFERAAKEAKMAIGLPVAWIVFCIIVMYWGSVTFDPQSTGIIGIPTYFFLILVGGLVVMILGIVISLYYIEDVSLDAWRE